MHALQVCGCGTPVWLCKGIKGQKKWRSAERKHCYLFDTSFIVSKYIFQVKETIWFSTQQRQRQTQLLNLVKIIFLFLSSLHHPKIFFIWKNYLNNHFLKSKLIFILNAIHIKEKCLAVENQKINNGIFKSSGISFLSHKYVLSYKLRHFNLSSEVYSSLVWSFRKYWIPENDQYFIITMSHLNFQSHWSVITVKIWDRNHFQFCKVSAYQVSVLVLHMGKKIVVISQTGV